MAIVLAAGYMCKLQAVVQDGGQVAINTFHYKVTGVGAPALTDADFAVYFDNQIAADMKAIIYNGATYKGSLCQVILPLPVTIPQIATAGAGTGTSGVNALPKQSCGLTSWKTALGGRKYRGRTYWPFMGTAMVTGDGVPSAGAQTLLANATVAVLNLTAPNVGGRSATVQLSVFHRSDGTSTPITTGLIKPAFATQRRRGDFGRLNSSPI